MSCPSISVFRTGAVGIRWDDPCLTYAALLGGGAVASQLSSTQLLQVQQGLALPITGYRVQIVMCPDDGGRVQPQEALAAVQAAAEAETPGAAQRHGTRALRLLAGRSAARTVAQPPSNAVGHLR
jgi:hypothetical protein